MNEPSTNSKTVFGFWVYLMTDCVLFASLFAVYAVLHVNTFTGPAGWQIFHLPNVLAETLILLTSSFTCGLGMISLHRRSRAGVVFWFAVTFLLGLAFLTIELNEFAGLISAGYSWQTSAFLSSFFTLVGTHGLHITIGLLWIAVMIGQVAWEGLTEGVMRRLTLLSMFWHFLDLIWIFIFTIVYLFGVLRI
jgi:cytochrome o ubiquinol oxidase subunit 3